MKKLSSEVFQDLCELNLTSENTYEIFWKGTRDNQKLMVYKDKLSGVIFIKDFYIGKDEYIQGYYRNEQLKSANNQSIPKPDFGRIDDLERRFKAFERFLVNKDILDFGCGHGDFLLKTNSLTKSSVGVELQKNLCNKINSAGISCFQDLNKIEDSSIDTIFLFHVFEHFNEPRKLLKSFPLVDI